jgi:hypothetical protein
MISPVFWPSCFLYKTTFKGVFTLSKFYSIYDKSADIFCQLVAARVLDLFYNF